MITSGQPIFFTLRYSEMAKRKTQEYDESKIKTLSALEHIRLRSGMYIGRLGDGSSFDDGIYILLKEVMDNSIDEYIMGHGNGIEVSIDAEQCVHARDYGRGIPLGKVIECVSVINTGAKYNDDVFQFSVGLNGVGTKAANALSSHFLVRSMRAGEFAQAVFSQGKLLKSETGKTDEKDGVYVEFIPDQEIFGPYKFDFEFIEQRFYSYACLNQGLRITFNGQEFLSKRGLYDFMSKEVGDQGIYDIVHCGSARVEFAFTHHNDSYGESYFSFVNGQLTIDGGTHLSAFKEGLLKGINEFYKSSFSGQDVREGIAAAVAVKVKDPIFESQTKNKLGNADIKSWMLGEVKSAVEDYLHKNATIAAKIREKILANERLRKELNDVKKEARAAAKRISITIPKLKDCKLHLGDKGGEESSIFITEGISAAGTMVTCRDVYTQAIYSLRGKPWNCYGYPRSAIYKNEELYNLMMALGIENEVESLRYGKTIIATDADFDGYHIRNLLLTFFLSYFEELLLTNRLYILETPLFRVKGKGQTRYCYNAEEKEQCLKDLGKNALVTRFKGLGEISPSEFGQFIGKDIRLAQVSIDTLKQNRTMLEFYMGKNTPTRRDYIMENLVEDLGA